MFTGFEFLKSKRIQWVLFTVSWILGTLFVALLVFSPYMVCNNDEAYLKGHTPLLYKGETVHRNAAQHLPLTAAPEANSLKFIGILLIVILLSFLLERFVYYFYARIYKNIKYFVLTYFVIVVVLIIAKFLQMAPLVPETLYLPYVVPIAVISITISILVTPNVSLLCGTIASVLVTLLFKGSLDVFLYLFLSSCVGTFVSYRRYRRNETILSGHVLGLFQAVLVVVFGLFNQITDPFWYTVNCGLGFCGGVLSAMISLGLLPYLEMAFRITTHHSLLELSDLSHPLLKKLMVTAPGTYQHSLMVGNLAEAAAEAVGADPILARVGAYFHDIGKMKRPLFFTENQVGQNPHHGLSPRMSKLIIASHVRDGLELADIYKLPPILKSFIAQHHGTTLVSFFFTQAIQTEHIKSPELEKDAFRYPGPKPQFKEAGILMLADSVEAAIRSMEKTTFAKIEAMIDKIFKHKLDDNQFDDCPLTLKEIHTIRETFLSLFRGIYHARIDYEDEIKSLAQRPD
ncbi:MAG: HD family phosphohydrolase [Candidatus Margulisiibacteriota bacterium]